MSGPRTVVQWLMWSHPKNLKSRGVYQLDRQSQKHRQVCHCWELEDELFAFLGRIGTACVDLLSRVFNTHLTGFLLRATKQEENQLYKVWGIMSLTTPKAVYFSSERKYTAAGGAFKYLGVVFKSDECRNKRIDTRIGKANSVLRELYCSVVTKRELSKNAKLSVFKSVFVPILTCGHESWVTTERILSKEQTAEMGCLRRVLGVALRDKEHRSEIRKAREVKPLLRIERSQLC